MEIDFLSWDSAFFNKKIGRIIIKVQDKSQLDILLENARSDNYDLIYLYSSESVYLEDYFLKKYNGNLVDRKVKYQLQFLNTLEESDKVEEYRSSMLTEDILTLAFISGTYSRFYVDKLFNPNDFYRLYRTWIIKSIHKEMADKLFVINDLGKTVGIVTIKFLKDFGEIGLIAVSRLSQRKGFGIKLIEACKKSLLEREISTLAVTTQIANKGACLFYERQGFTMFSISNVYHLWL